MRKLICILAILASSSAVADDYIGSLSGNRFTPDGIRNPWSKWNNPFYADSPRNPFGPYGNRFSPYSPYNEFSTQGPRVYGGPFEDQSAYTDEAMPDPDADLYQ